MRTIPADMLTQFQDQQGINPIFVIEITWPGTDIVKYSTCEFVDQEIYPYVKEFKDFESVSHVEGLGAVSTISVSFYDQFGHFKEKMDTVDFFTDTTVVVYLTLDGVELYDLFEGIISDRPRWSNNIFDIEVKSNNIDREVGYQPSIDDVDISDPNYDLIDKKLNSTGVWPAVYGSVKNYEAPVVLKQRVAVVQETVPYSGIGLYYELDIDTVDNFVLDTLYSVNLVGKAEVAFSILGEGLFTMVGDLPKFRLNKIGVTSTWYKNIAYTVLPNEAISETPDDIVTRIEIDPGTVTLEDTTVLDTLGPDGLATSAVWLQYMAVFFKFSTPSYSSGVWRNCVDQTGNICTLNGTLEYPTGAFDKYITKVQKLQGLIYEIPKDTQIYILGDTLTYIADTKAGTTVDQVGFREGDDIKVIDAAAYSVSSADLWIGTHPPVTHITMLAELYMRFLEHFTKKDKEGEGILVSATNTITTDAAAIADISGLAVSSDVTDTVDFVYLTIEDAQNVIPEIAWQANKAIRYTRSLGSDILELIDLTDISSTPVHTFKEENVLLGSMSYSISAKDDLYTIFNADFQTNDLSKELEVVKYKRNVDKYDESLLNSDYYIFKNKTTVETKLAYWRDRLSEYHYRIELTGFMDAFGLEVWDRVEIDIDTATFYDPALGTPFVNTHTATPRRWYSTGRIRKISPDMARGTIDFEIELDTIFGDPSDNEYRRGLYNGF